jgi:Bifunctional DNA primase/polymerase, N-terminal.
MVDNKCLEAALKYVAFGFSVIPVKRDKTPYLSWTEFQQRRATPEEIKEWFKKMA